MPVIGTAGHVDHGKSTLVQALTGRDPDRWEEEKRRGLTIDLGFAWTVLPGGSEVSFVDVPGHERFAKNMLAGIETIDIALLVVAADEGWKPQSEEHLAVLDLLEIERGVVALTKVDRADADLVELATLEVAEKIEGTRLSPARIIPTSVPAGTGIDDLRHELSDLLPPATDDRERPRMWIDRSFSISGAGTVVTGTLTGGSLSTDGTVWIWPGPLEARVRGIQSHEHHHDVVQPTRRVAVNLVGIDRGKVSRGAMLGLPGQWHPTRRAAVTIRPARYVQELRNRGAYHIHIGSGAWPVRLHLIEEGLAIIDLPQPLCLEVGDRFILRDTGRRLVVGGGRIIDPGTARRTHIPDLVRLRRLPEEPSDNRARLLLHHRQSELLSVLAAQTGGGSPRHAVVVGEQAFDPEHAGELGERIAQIVDRYHEDNPLRKGIGVAELSGRIGLGTEATTRLAELHPNLEVAGAHIRRSGHTVELTPEQETVWQRAKAALADADAADVPRLKELDLPNELMHALIRRGELIQISEDLVYLPEQVAHLRRIISSFESPFTVSEFKERASLSRKYAIPFLEWTDETGMTVRTGDRRRAL